eukprot:5798678-Amphidinium_carterae.1
MPIASPNTSTTITSSISMEVVAEGSGQPLSSAFYLTRKSCSSAMQSASGNTLQSRTQFQLSTQYVGRASCDFTVWCGGVVCVLRNWQLARTLQH